MNLFKTSSILTVIFCLTAALNAQEQEQEQKQSKAAKQARFLFLSKRADTPDTIQVKGRSGSSSMLISTRSPGKYHALPATGEIIIGTFKIVDGEDVMVPLAVGKMPEGATRVLALVYPVNTKGYQMIVLDERKFKPGSICFINTTSNNIGALIDKKRYGVKPKSNSIVHPTVRAKSRNTYAAFYDRGTRAKPHPSKMITESTWNISPERAEICMFYLHPARNTIGMRVLSSFYAKNPTGQASRQ